MEEDSRHKRLIQWTGFFAGPVAAVCCLLWLPTEYSLVKPPPSSAQTADSESADPSGGTLGRDAAEQSSKAAGPSADQAVQSGNQGIRSREQGARKSQLSFWDLNDA